MTTRLVVGCGSTGRTLVTTLAGQPGTLTVIEERERRVERLRDEGIAATHVGTLDAAAIGANARDGDVDTVIVAGDTPGANLRRARAATEAFPDAFLFVYAGEDATPDVLSDLRGIADTLVDPATAAASFLTDRVGDEGLQLRKLRSALRDTAEPLAIVAHDNPDPDAIASAIALQRIAGSVGVTADVCYYGGITHQENRAFVNLLDFELTNLEPDADLSTYGSFALVDHSRPGVNDQLPADTPVDIVIDHHPPRAPVDAGFVDLRSNVGATSTLLVQYLEGFGLPIDEDVATGLLFGIRVDTNDFRREVSTDDFEAAATILPRADMGALDRIETPSISGDTFEVIASAISNRRRRGSILTSCVDRIGDRDALSQAADRLLDMEGVNATVVYGIMDGVIYVSGRARGTDLDLGETLREAFDQIGSAGGHADMAGAQIPVADTTLEARGDTLTGAGDWTADGPADDAADGTDGAGEDDADDAETGDDRSIDVDLEKFVTERFLEAIEERPSRETTGLYSGTFAEGEPNW